jgi:hypothetical protein
MLASSCVSHHVVPREFIADKLMNVCVFEVTLPDFEHALMLGQPANLSGLVSHFHEFSPLLGMPNLPLEKLVLLERVDQCLHGRFDVSAFLVAFGSANRCRFGIRFRFFAPIPGILFSLFGRGLGA